MTMLITTTSIVRVLTYLFYLGSLYWLCWQTACRLFPRDLHTPQERVLLTLLGGFALQAMMVYCLGMAGLLYPLTFRVIGICVFLLALLWHTRSRADAFLEAFSDCTRALFRPLPIGIVLLFVVLLSLFFTMSLIPTQEYDSVQDLIPGIINWSHAHYLPAVQVGPSQYTKFWEFQYVPGFVLCGNDAALLFPGLLALLAMLCVVYQLTHGFDVPERFCAAACWLVMGYVSFLWGSGHPSISSVKNDVISGVAYCTALLCVISLRKSVAASLPGYLVLFTCALLMLIGTKTTGLALTGVAVLAWACVVILRQGAMKPLARGGVIMLPPVIACLWCRRFT